MVQVPALTNVTVDPLTVQTVVVNEAKVTGRPKASHSSGVSGMENVEPSTWKTLWRSQQLRSLYNSTLI